MTNFFGHKDLNEIPVFFSTDNNYLPYLDVAIRSLIKNASKEHNYRIVILNTGLDREKMDKIKALSSDQFIINFVDVSHAVDDIKHQLRNVYHFGLATYYRLFIEELFPEYDKILYLDCDIVVLGDISKLLFRMKHLMKYHSESVEYRSFLSILCGYYDNDEDRLFPLYETIQRSIPHLYGSYTDKQNLVPLDIQGKEYKMFVSCDNLRPAPQEAVPFDINNRNKFVVEIDSFWKVNTPVPPLKVEYQLYEYLCKIQCGKLAQMDDRNHNLLFYGFISNLVQQTDFKEKVIILTSDNQQLTLSRTFGKKVTLK